MNVRWSKGALCDAGQAAEYIAGDRPLAALHWTDGLIDAMRRAGELPESGRVVPEINNPRLREIVYRDVRVIYRIDRAEVVVLIVWHTRRDVRKLERRLQAYRVRT